MNKIEEKPKYVDLNGNVCYAVMVDGNATKFSQYITSIQTSVAFGKIAVLDISFENTISHVDGTLVSDVDEFQLGKEIELKVGYGEAKETIFKGPIIKRMVKRSGSFVFAIRAKHKADEMTKDRNLESYESKSVEDVVHAVCEKYKIKAEAEKPGREKEKYPQLDYNDWDFINMIAESEQMVVVTTPEGLSVKSIDAASLSKRLDGKAVLDVVNGYNINSFSAEMDDRHSHMVYNADGFDTPNQELTKTESICSNVCKSKSNVDKGKKRRVSTESNMDDVKETSALLNALSVRNDLSFLMGSVDIGGYASLWPGDIICLWNIGKGFDGKVLVSSVEHKISAGKWSTNLEIGFEDVHYAEKYDDIAPKPSLGMLPPVNGLMLAKVESLAGDPSGEGRIYVKLMNSSNVKMWCRVATLDAGNKRGSFFMPEIGDEVVVGFVGGNSNNAIVLGMLHSSKAPAPRDITDDNHVKGFYSREKIQLLFDDEKKALSIETPGGNKLMISDDEKGISLKDQNGNTIVMNDQGVTIESKKALTLKATQDVSIEGNNVNIKANAQLVAKGNASAEFSASGNTVIKCGLVQIN